MADDVIPGIYDLTLYRGDTFARTFSFAQAGVPLELPTSGWAAEVRSPDGSGPVTGTFTIDASGAAAGVIVLSATAAEVATFKEGRYDIRLTAGADVRTYIRGAIKILRDVTRG